MPNCPWGELFRHHELSPILCSPRPNQARGGICVRPNANYISQQTTSDQLDSIEMTCVKLTFKDSQPFNIWCPYVPPEKPKLLEELCKQITEKMPDNTILISDLNAKSYQWNNVSENNHGRILEDCMTQNKLVCVNDGQVTRRNSKSVIDLCITTQKMYKKVIECTTLTHENVKSDHIGIYVYINTCLKESDEVKEDPRWNIHKYDIDEWRNSTHESFKDLVLMITNL